MRFSIFFFFNVPATTEIYTLFLHDALPISAGREIGRVEQGGDLLIRIDIVAIHEDRKSTRLNSSHEWISYAVFCLKKKKNGLGAIGLGAIGTETVGAHADGKTSVPHHVTLR